MASPSTLGGVADDNLLDTVGTDAIDELGERQVLRTHPFEGRQQLSEDEVAAAHGARALDRDEIVHARDDAEDVGVALVVATHGAHRLVARVLDLRDVPAADARLEHIVEASELGAEVARERLVRGHEEEHVALRGLLPHAGEAREERYDALELPCEHRARPRPES